MKSITIHGFKDGTVKTVENDSGKIKKRERVHREAEGKVQESWTKNGANKHFVLTDVQGNTSTIQNIPVCRVSVPQMSFKIS